MRIAWGHIVPKVTEWLDRIERRAHLARLKSFAYNQEIRSELLTAYGNICACCDEAEPSFLQLDHVNGGGRKDRESFVNPSAFYRELKRRGYPKDEFRLLCSNCNFAKKDGRECPHKMPIGPNLEELLKLHKELCDEARSLMEKKNQDYGRGDDPFHNFRAHGTVGILVRMSDKLARLESFRFKGFMAVKDESVKDTVLDILNYSILLYGYLAEAGELEGKPSVSKA
jgi:hypothetical protein